MRETVGPDFAAITRRQQQVWSAGDCNVIAVATMAAAEMLVRAVDPKAGDRVLDVACGSGNVALVAARRYCEVTGIDYVPALLERAKLRAAAEGPAVDFRVADAQALPFPDGGFDAVVSVFGVMSAPDQERPPPSCCGSAGRPGRSACRPGCPRDTGATCSAPTPRSCPRPRGCARRCDGVTRTGCGSCSGAGSAV